MIISFAYTKEQFLDGSKKVTRRRWKRKHLKAWQKAWDEGRLEHDAVSRDLRAGGERIGRFRLTCRPYLEKLRDMPRSDLALEGFPEFTCTRQYMQVINADPDEEVTVVRFERVA